MPKTDADLATLKGSLAASIFCFSSLLTRELPGQDFVFRCCAWLLFAKNVDCVVDGLDALSLEFNFFPCSDVTDLVVGDKYLEERVSLVMLIGGDRRLTEGLLLHGEQDLSISRKDRSNLSRADLSLASIPTPNLLFECL